MAARTQALSLLLACATLSGCAFFKSPAAATGGLNTIKVGLVASFSGNNAGSGDTLSDAINMALVQINAGGVLGGRKLELMHGDDRSDPTTAVTVAKDLIAKGAVALIGPNSSGSAKQVLLNASKPLGVPMISPNASSPDLTNPAVVDGGGFFFRTCPSDALQGKVLAAKAKALGYKKVVVLHVDNPYGDGLATVFDASFGMDAVTDIKYDYISDPIQQAKYDFTGLVKRVLDAAPDAVLLVGYSSDASTVINDWVLDGRLPKLPWLFTDSINRQDFVDNVKNKDRIEGFPGTAPYGDPAFLTAFQAMFPKDMGVHGSTAFDAMALIALAIQQAGNSSPASIKDHLRTVSGPAGDTVGPNDLAQGLVTAASGKPVAYTGWSGPFNLDERGDMATGRYEVWTVKGGKLTATPEILTP